MCYCRPFAKWKWIYLDVCRWMYCQWLTKNNWVNKHNSTLTNSDWNVLLNVSNLYLCDWMLLSYLKPLLLTECSLCVMCVWLVFFCEMENFVVWCVIHKKEEKGYISQFNWVYLDVHHFIILILITFLHTVFKCIKKYNNSSIIWVCFTTSLFIV